jgi:hypothetical protein
MCAVPSQLCVLQGLQEHINVFHKGLSRLNILRLYIFGLTSLTGSVLGFEIPDARYKQCSADVGYSNQIGDIGKTLFHLCFDNAGARFGCVDANDLGREWEIRVSHGTHSWPRRVVRDGRVGNKRAIDQNVIQIIDGVERRRLVGKGLVRHAGRPPDYINSKINDDRQ